MLSAESKPSIKTDNWTFTGDGLVESPVTWTWDQIHALPAARHEGAIHCVTSWSKFGMRFDGVSGDTLLGTARPVLAATKKCGCAVS